MELEFSVDPLFKKASADFDEGGAKGLLLNHLTIDSNGRIVFDSSDEAEDATAEVESGKQSDIGETATDLSSGDVEGEAKVGHVNIPALAAKFFPDLTLLDEQDICPSLRNFDLGDAAGSSSIPFLKAPDDWRQEKQEPQSGGLGDQTGIFLDGDNVAGFEDDADGVLGGFDEDGNAGFGEGGEAWAKNIAIESHTTVINVDSYQDKGDGHIEGIRINDFDSRDNQFAPKLLHRNLEGGHVDILSYFDNALQKNWAGPEHWRIRRIKDTNKPQAPAAKRKEKEPFLIKFEAPLDPGIAESLYTPASSNAAISIPKALWKSKTRNLLPDDKHFNSTQLLRLFLKPKARMGSRRKALGTARSARQDRMPDEEMNEAFWARKESGATDCSPDSDTPQGNYDANFFQDDGIGFADGPPDDDDEFADAREVLSPGESDGKQLPNGDFAPVQNQEGAFGTQLVTQSRRLRPEYVQYARVAKKVDVRRLKEEMWRSIGFADVRCLPILRNKVGIDDGRTTPPKTQYRDPPRGKTLHHSSSRRL